jgi:hypothetical protein
VAQGTITRLTYERLGILLTDAPAYKESGTKYSDLIRIQSMDYSFSHEVTDIKAVGSDKLVTRSGQSPIIRAPSINCNIEYLFSEGQNEIAAGLHMGRNDSVIKNYVQTSSTDDINILVVASDEDSHKDLSFLNSESDFEDYNVIGIGNAFLMNYAYNASVGSLPTSSLSFAASNMKYDAYSASSRPTLPAVKLGVNNINSTEEVHLDVSKIKDHSHDRENQGYIFDQHFNPEVSAIKPGDIKITMTKRSGGRGGAILDSLSAAVQSISIDLPIPRQDIYGMGSNYVFNRKLKLPIIGSLSVDMVVRGYAQDQVDSFLTQTDVYNILVEHATPKRVVGNQGETLVENLYYYIAVENNDWRRVLMESFTHSVSGSAGDTAFSSDGNFYYVCINGFTWGKINLTNSSESFSGNIAYSYNFIYVLDGTTWKKFSVNTIDFDSIGAGTALDISSGIAFEVNRAQLKNQSYSHAIGSNVQVNSAMTFDVTKTDGLRLYFK